MPRELIDSIDDPRVAVYRDLPRSNLTRPSGLFVAEGHLLVERLLMSSFALSSIVLDEKFLTEWEAKCPADVPVYIVPSVLMNQLVGFKFHRGVLACGKRQALKNLSDVALPEHTRQTIVVCVDVNDPENMGGILRNSAAFGVDLVIVSQRCADPFSRRVLRTSMGTVFKIPLVHSSDIAGDLRTLQEIYGFQLAATVLDDAAESLEQFQRAARFGLLFGNEGHGLSAEIVAQCDRKIMIPMRLGTDSLNVAVAAGIFLYHVTK